MSTKKVTVNPKKSATGKKPTAARGQSIGQNVKASRQRVVKAVQQNKGNILSGGIR